MTGQLAKDGYGSEEILIERSVDMRFRRQVHVLNVPIKHSGPLDASGLTRIEELFEQLYMNRYGKEAAFRKAGTEVVAFRVRGTGLVRKPALKTDPVGSTDASLALVERKQAYVAAIESTAEIDGYDFQKLAPGNEIRGPAIMWTPTTTVVLSPNQQVRVDEFKNLVIVPARG